MRPPAHTLSSKFLLAKASRHELKMRFRHEATLACAAASREGPSRAFPHQKHAVRETLCFGGPPGPLLMSEVSRRLRGDSEK